VWLGTGTVGYKKKTNKMLKFVVLSAFLAVVGAANVDTEIKMEVLQKGDCHKAAESGDTVSIEHKVINWLQFLISLSFVF
jgi:hypothetical protein